MKIELQDKELHLIVQALTSVNVHGSVTETHADLVKKLKKHLPDDTKKN